MTKIHQNVKEKYKGNEKGLLKEKATAAFFRCSAPKIL